MCSGGRGLPLVPWPNRLHEGRYAFDGEEHVLPLDEPERRNAIHGLARYVSWTPVDVADDRVTMSVTLWPRHGWPFTLSVSVEYALGPAGLVVTTVAEGTGAGALPYACGAHPYLTVGTPTVDDAELHLPARTWLPTDDDQIPTGREEVAGTPLDFRSPARDRRRPHRPRLHRPRPRGGRAGPGGAAQPGRTAARPSCGSTARTRGSRCSPATRSPSPSSAGAGSRSSR